MPRRYGSKSIPAPSDRSDIDAALAALSADDLREVVRDMLLELDDRAHGHVVSRLIERAARNASDWAPESPSDAAVSETLSFAEAAKRVGYADPSDVDDHLQKGANAFLGKDYAAATQILHALLLPVSEVEIDLGQHELVDEVLGADVGECVKKKPDNRVHERPDVLPSSPADALNPLLRAGSCGRERVVWVWQDSGL